MSVDSSKTEKNRDKNSVNYYLEQLPKTPEDFILSDNKIKEAYYQAALIFREEIKSYKLSTEMFQKIILHYLEDPEYSSLAYYNIYTNHTKQQENKEAENIKQIILDNYPNSVYSKIIKEPTIKTTKKNQQTTPEERYQKTYLHYKNKNYEKVLGLTINTPEDIFKKQALFLRALSLIAVQDTVKAIELLKEISSKNPTSSIEKEADYIVKSIIDPKNIIKANQQAITGSNYIFKNQTPHMVIIIISKKGADINYLKTLISDYHSRDYSNEVFEISAMLMGMENHLLMIKTFKNASETNNYTNLISTNHEIMKELDKSNHRIMAIDVDNFKYFYTNKDTRGYYDFYQNNYVNQN